MRQEWRRFSRAAIKFASAGSILVSAAAANTQERSWVGTVHNGGASLIYGTAETDDVALSFECSGNSSKLNFSYSFEPQNASDGMKVDVTLRVGEIIVPIHATGARLEDDLFVVEGATPLDDNMVDLLMSGGVMQVLVGNSSAEIRLDGAKEAAQSLFETCTVKRAPPGYAAEDEYATCSLGTGLVTLLKFGVHDVASARAAAFGLCYHLEPVMTEDNKNALREFVDFSLQTVADRLYGPQ